MTLQYEISRLQAKRREVVSLFFCLFALVLQKRSLLPLKLVLFCLLFVWKILIKLRHNLPTGQAGSSFPASIRQKNNCLLWVIYFIPGALGLVGQNLSANINKVLSNSAFDHALVGVSIIDMSGTILFAQNQDVALVPASTMKLLTTLSAIDILGAEYQYKTIIGYRGELLDDGSLYGDLIIRGSGDPSLGSEDDPAAKSMDNVIDEIIAMVQRRNIYCIDGQILIDASLFDQMAVHPGWHWDDVSNYYAAGIWGFTIHENSYDIHFKRSRRADQDTRIVTVSPEVPGLTLVNEVKTGPKGSGDNAYIYGDPYGHEMKIQGTIPPGKGRFVISGAIPDPGSFFLHHLSVALERSSIEYGSLGGMIHESLPLIEIGHLVSPSLAHMVSYINQVSSNLYCESLVKTIGTINHEQGSWSNGILTIMNHWKDNNIPIEGTRLVDGSGLSTRNRVTAQAMSSYVRSMINRHGLEEMKTYLPQAGSGGSVRRLLRGRDVQSHSWLKSGSMTSVLGYSGFIETQNGDILMITLLSNGHSVGNSEIRQQFEKIIEHCYTHRI